MSQPSPPDPVPRDCCRSYRGAPHVDCPVLREALTEPVTAGRSAGTEQGQGRDNLWDRRCELGHLQVQGMCAERTTVDGDVRYTFVAHTPSAPVPPARDSGRASEQAMLQAWSEAADDTTLAEIRKRAAQIDSERDSGRDDIASRDPWCTCGHPQSTHDRVDREPGTMGHGPCDLCSCRGWDSGRDEAREAVARWLAIDNQAKWQYLAERSRDIYREDADELLSLPAVAALLRDGTTT